VAGSRPGVEGVAAAAKNLAMPYAQVLEAQIYGATQPHVIFL